jgi:uncharacterized protein YjbJ (UPF0337 family)
MADYMPSFAKPVFAKFCNVVNQCIHEINPLLVKIILEPFIGLRQAILPLNKESIMSLEAKFKATAKNIEGKIQEAVGELTGDPKTQAEGKAKQVEAAVQHTVENVKDKVKEVNHRTVTSLESRDGSQTIWAVYSDETD